MAVQAWRPRDMAAEWRAARRRRRLAPDLRAGALAAIERTGVVFVHVPKCGGKSVIRDLYGLGTHDWFGHANIRFYQALLGPARFGRALKLAVLRDPVERCLSAFRFAQGGGFGQPADLALQARLDGLDFESFVQDGHLQAVAEKYVIFRPQHGFVTGADGKVLVDAVCRLDHLGADLSALVGDRLGLSGVSHENRSHHGGAVVPSPGAVAAIEALYADDVALFATAQAAWERPKGRAGYLAPAAQSAERE